MLPTFTSEPVLWPTDKVNLIPLGFAQASSLSAQQCSHALRWRKPSKYFFLNGHKVPIETKKASSLWGWPRHSAHIPQRYGEQLGLRKCQSAVLPKWNLRNSHDTCGAHCLYLSLLGVFLQRTQKSSEHRKDIPSDEGKPEGPPGGPFTAGLILFQMTSAEAYWKEVTGIYLSPLFPFMEKERKCQSSSHS